MAYLKQVYQLPVVSVNTLNRLGATKRSQFDRRTVRFYKRRKDAFEPCCAVVVVADVKH